MKFKPIALGVSAGILWGACIFLTTLLSYLTGYGTMFLEALPMSLYPGYEISIMGSIIGAVYGFIDAFICGIVLAWIYNKVAKV